MRRYSIGERGLTMVLALFLTFLLSTLSLAFVTLMMEDSRGSMSSGWQVMATETAEWGVETALSYMGRGGNWQAAFDSQRLSFFDVLNPNQPNGVDHLLASAGGSGRLQVQITAPGEGSDSALRVLQLGDPSLPNGAVLALGPGLYARVEIEVRPLLSVLSSYGPGQVPLYSLESRAELFSLDENFQEKMLAVSLLEAQVRPEIETTALFQVENLRSWDVQGGGHGSAHLADRILIPSHFESAGSVRVTGTDPRNPNAPWREQAGNVRFENPNSASMVFRGQLSVAQLFNLDGSGGTVTEGNPEQFPGGVLFGSDYVPLPEPRRFLNHDIDGSGQIGGGVAPTPGDVASGQQEWGLLAVAAIDREGSGSSEGPYVSGYYKVGKDLVSEAHQLNPRVPDFDGAIPIIQQDYRPPIPEVEVVIKDGGFLEVNVWQTNEGDGGYSTPAGSLNTQASQTMGNLGGPLGTTFHVSQLKNGVLYVEGGQAIVRSELQGGEATPFEGRLQIVAAEDGVRRGTPTEGGGVSYGHPSTSLYHQAANEYFEWQKSRALGEVVDPDPEQAESFQPPPYSAQDLQNAFNNGRISTPVEDLSGVPSTEPYWPAPPASVKREGNLVVAGDILKHEGKPSMLGLTAENFLLLNDRTMNEKARPNELQVDAVLTSFRHSLQLDWDNTSNNRVQGSDGGRLHTKMMTPGFNGKILMNGSMLAPFSNVEGDLQGRGYPRQEFIHDTDLARSAPPYQPRTLLSEYPNDQIGISWTIVNFIDRTSLGVRVPD